MPYSDALIRGIKSINAALAQSGGTVGEEQIETLQAGFNTTVRSSDLDRFIKTFNKANSTTAGLNMVYKANTERQAGRTGGKSQPAYLDSRHYRFCAIILQQLLRHALRV